MQKPRHHHRHRVRGFDRLGDGQAFRAGGDARARHRQRHARAVFRRGSVDPKNARSVTQVGPQLRASQSRHPRCRSGVRFVQAASRSNRRRRPYRGAAFARLGGARSADRFHGQRQRHAESARSGAKFCPEAPFVFTSTNKVYGDTPNRLPLRELPLRWEIAEGHEYEPGISETMSIDHTKHSLFGASKAAADILVQEYGRYFGYADGLFSRRLPHRSRARRHRAARFPLLPHDLRGERPALSRFRLQGKTGAR